MEGMFRIEVGLLIMDIHTNPKRKNVSLILGGAHCYDPSLLNFDVKM